MTFDNPILFFLCSLGVFNGFLVSFYFLFLAKQKRSQNRLFGLLVLLLSIRIGKSLYVLFSDNRDLLILQIGLSACFLIGASLFFYIKSSVENRKEIPLSWKLHILVLFFIVVVVGFLKPYKSNIDFWKSFFIVIYVTWGIYIALSGFILRTIFRKKISKNVSCTTAESWLIAVFIGNLLIYLAYLIGYFWLYLVGTLTFSVVFYGLFFFFMFKKNRETIFKDIPEKYEAKKINKKEASPLIEKLRGVMSEKELFRNSDIKLKDVASELQISPHQLSQLLNDNLGKSFAQFINGYRIEEAKRLLKENDKITLEAIGFESGFSSKSTFYATFKKLMAITPAQYKNKFLK